MGFFKKALNAIKNWVSGGSSKSSKSKSSKSSSGSKKSSRSSSSGSSYSSSGSYYGGGTRKAFKAQLDEEERKRKQKDEQLKNAFKANASMSSSSSSSSSSSEKKTPPDPKQQAFKASQKRITKKLSEIEAKQTEDPKEALRRKAMQKREAEKASYYKATKNKFNPETGNKAHDSEARRRIRSGDYQTDADAAKWEYKAHPKSTMAMRTAANAAAFGVPDFVIKKSEKHMKPELREAENLYRKTQEEHPYIKGGAELAGSLVGFGGTAKATDALGAKMVGKFAPNAAERLAESTIGKGLAKRTVNKAVKKGLVSESTEELVKQVGRDRANKIVAALGNEAAQNLTTGAIYDIANASKDHELFSKEWWKELGESAAFNTVATTGVAGVSGLGGSRRLVGDAVRRIGAANKLDDLIRARRAGSVASNALAPPKLGEALDDTIARRATRTAEQNAVERQMPQMRNAMRETFTGNADNARRVDMNDILAQNSPFRQADEAVRPQNVENVAPPQTPRQAGQAYQYPDTETYIRELDEKGEQWLGQYGHITDNGDGTYNLFRNGEGDRTLSREEATDYIARSRDALQSEELARAERERVTRTTPLNEAENARLAEIDDEVARLGTESNADAAELRSNRYNGLDDYQARQAERARNERNLINERDNIIRKEPERPLTDAEIERNALQEEYDELAELHRTASADGSMSPVELQQTLDDMQELNMMIRDLDAQISRTNAEPPRAEAPAPQTAEAPRQTVEPRAELPTPRAEARPTPPPTREVAAETPNINEGNVPRPEPPRAETTAPTAEAPQRPLTQEEAIREARETQTRKESEDLMMAHFEETGEADLGMYGKVTPNGDGTYHVKIEGVDREIDIPKEEVERRIKESTKRAYDEPKVVDSLEDVVYKRHERASFRERLKKAWGMGRQMISDSLASFEDTERALAREQGRQVDYGAINEVRAHQAKANRSISNKQLDWQGNKYEGFVERVGADGQVYRIENGKSIADIYKGMDEETERAFDLYLELRHAPDRLLEGKPVFDNIVDKSGRNFNSATACTEEADRILAEHPEFAQKAEEIYQYTRNELQNRVDAGLLTQETFDDWFSRYPNYVPTHREGFNEIHGVSGSTVGATEIKGAKGSDRGIMSIRDQLTAATTRNWRDMSTNEMFRKYFGDKIASDLAQDADGGIERVLDNTINLGKNESSGKYFADIYIKGKKHTVELEDRFYEGLRDLYKNGMTGNALFDTTNEAFSKVAGVWKNLITEWSPIFMVKNGMRDFPEAVINSRQTKEFLECMGPARRDLATGGQFSEALRDAGISQSSFIDLDKAIREGKDKASLLARANGAVEMFPRLCEYMATLKKAGVNINDPNAIRNASRELKARAAANAADVTVNFGRSGSVGKMINKGLVPFFNPSVQGWSKFVRNVTENRGDTKALLSFAVKATALGAGATTFNNFMLQDNDNYQQISARDKANNYIIPLGDPDTTNMFIKIPSSRFASVYGLPMVNAFNENKMGWAEAIKVANDQVAPIDPIESTLFRPFIDAAKNETWYGTPIVGGALEDLPPSEQYDPNTSAIGKALGRATQNLPRELQISPKKADYIIDAETGVAGDFILPMATPSKQGGGKGLLGKTLPAAGNVLKKQFTIDSNTQNDLSSRFYKQLEDATVSKNSSKATAKDQAEYKRLSAYKDEVSGLTKAITDLQNGDRATKQDDIYGLQKVRNKLIQDALNGKQAPSTAKKIDAVQKYVGTTYAIENFGSSTDKEAMKVYGASVYGNISEKEMQQKIDADKDFYKGVRAVGKLEDKLAKATGSKATSALSRSVALAEVGASDELFGAYEGTKKSRTETDIKMNRARNYISDGGSSDEFIKLEKTRKTLGKLSDYDKEAELDKALADLKSNQISEAEYYQRQGEINYNANISYVGLATSLAQANAPSRGYVLYDIKAKNVQKGVNLAAMGFTARDYREMAKAVDADGNGYPKKQEIIDYVNSRDDIEDKATLYDALYYYKSSRNPFGAPTNYSRDDAAATGKKNGVEQISDETGDLDLKDDEESKSGYGYRRRGYRRWRRWGRGGGKAKTPALRTDSAFKAKAKLPNSKSSSSSSASSKAPTVKRSYKSMAPSSRTTKSTNVNMRGLKLTPPTPKTKKGGKKS